MHVTASYDINTRDMGCSFLAPFGGFQSDLLSIQDPSWVVSYLSNCGSWHSKHLQACASRVNHLVLRCIWPSIPRCAFILAQEETLLFKMLRDAVIHHLRRFMNQKWSDDPSLMRIAHDHEQDHPSTYCWLWTHHRIVLKSLNDMHRTGTLSRSNPAG